MNSFENDKCEFVIRLDRNPTPKEVREAVEQMQIWVTQIRHAIHLMIITPEKTVVDLVVDCPIDIPPPIPQTWDNPVPFPNPYTVAIYAATPNMTVVYAAAPYSTDQVVAIYGTTIRKPT
jgi:hypothetical protein